jgi:hypothetical protein
LRDLKRYPITIAEILQCLVELAEQLRAEDNVGDMRPLLLRKAATMITRLDFAHYALNE